MGKVFSNLHFSPCNLMPTIAENTKKEDHKDTRHVLERNILPPPTNVRSNNEAEIRASTLWVNTNCHNIYSVYWQPMKIRVNVEHLWMLNYICETNSTLWSCSLFTRKKYMFLPSHMIGYSSWPRRGSLGNRGGHSRKGTLFKRYAQKHNVVDVSVQFNFHKARSIIFN